MAFFDIYKELGGGVLGVLKGVLYMIPVFILIGIIIAHFRNKAVYKYKVRIFKVRENGKVKELNCKGGYIGRRNSAPFFRIKLGKWWWQYRDLNTTPNPAFMDEEDRVYFKQIDVDTYVQLKRKFIKEDEIEYAPVESDIKYGTILSVQKIKEVLRTEPTWKRIAPYATLITLALIFVIAYAMLMKNCSG